MARPAGRKRERHGDRDRAIASYERSLVLDPGNQDAVEMLKRLRE